MKRSFVLKCTIISILAAAMSAQTCLAGSIVSSKTVSISIDPAELYMDFASENDLSEGADSDESGSLSYSLSGENPDNSISYASADISEYNSASTADYAAGGSSDTTTGSNNNSAASTDVTSKPVNADSNFTDNSAAQTTDASNSSSKNSVNDTSGSSSNTKNNNSGVSADAELSKLPGDSDGMSADDFGGEIPTEMAEEITENEQNITYYETDAGSSYVVYSNQKKEDQYYQPFNNGYSADRDTYCIILIPYGEDIEDFISTTEWNLYSAMDGFNLICLSTDWSSSDDESSEVSSAAQDYYDDVLSDLSDTMIKENDRIFLIGYEDAGDFAEDEACRNTEFYTGLVTLGTTGLSASTLQSYEDSGNVSPLSVWMIAPSLSSVLNENISFWKDVNYIKTAAYTSYTQTYADYMYMRATSSTRNITDEDEMGIVYVSTEDDCCSSSVTGNVSRHFIRQITKTEIAFSDPITGGEIKGISDRHYTYYRTQFEGQQRDYWLYIPDNQIIDHEASSLILCLHGSGGSGEDMIFRTSWQDTAAENNCIVIFPSSLYLNGSQHYWQNIDEEIDFLMYLIDSVCEKYNVDRSRIYVTGYSNGAGMAQNLAIKCSDVFAAATLSAPAYWDQEYYGAPTDIHEVAILFSYGSEDKYLKEYDITAEIDDYAATSHLEYWRNMYGFEQDFYQMEQNGIFRKYTFFNKYNIPVCVWMIVDGKKHTYPKEEVPAFYAFMSAYTKDADGNLYYEGELVKSK